MSLTFRSALRKLNTEPSICPSHQIAVHFGKSVSEKKIFRNLKQEWPVAAMFVNGSKQNEHTLKRTFHRCVPPSFKSFGQAVSEKIFRN